MGKEFQVEGIAVLKPPSPRGRIESYPGNISISSEWLEQSVAKRESK